jgi:hypothetical protein
VPDAGVAISDYGCRLHRAVVADGEHHVASPLGAWLLIAAVADSRPGPLEECLGMPAAEANEVLRELLAKPHPAVVSALAWWTVPTIRSEAIRVRFHRLPREVAVGDIPSQADADTWAAEHTLGLINRFPTNLDRETLMVLASALATRVSWTVPFTLVPATEMGTGSRWPTSLNEVLLSPASHSASLVSSPVGLLGVHIAKATEGLEVCSVIGPPEVSATDLITTWLGTAPTTPCDLFDVPLGDGHAWSLAEVDGEAGMTRTSAVLPAWSASSQIALTDPSLGFGTSFARLNNELAVPAPLQQAFQVARADYSRTGFVAAAVTSAIFGAGIPERGAERHLTLRFDRPFAVFATTVHERGPRIEPLSPWHGLPVFSGWVSEPTDATGT